MITTIFIPTIIVTSFNFSPRGGESATEVSKPQIRDKKKDPLVQEEDYNFHGHIVVYNTRNQQVINMPLEEYVKGGVVAAEMPGEFHIEALKAQAVASRTYALSRAMNYPEGHPDHIEAPPLCTGIHCQAYLTKEELQDLHAKDWMEKYWSKIEEAVNSTKGQVLYYNDELIESPPYHSTSGGMTEDSLNVFAVDKPYLKAVESPYEEEAPKFKALLTLTGDEFISKLNTKYPGTNITKENLQDKIKLVEKKPHPAE